MAAFPADTLDRYPMGPPPREASPGALPSYIAAIAAFPGRFSQVYEGLDAGQLAMPYRSGGWTLRQLAHHVADSHMNAFARLKLALTEDWPTIKPYDEKRWAETAEVQGPVEPSLALLPALHARWAALLQALTPEEWARGYVHPENGRTSLPEFAALYSWHGEHHLAHAARLRERMQW